MKELGKWFMDISKYMVTALLITTIFSDMNEPIIFKYGGNPLHRSSNNRISISK